MYLSGESCHSQPWAITQTTAWRGRGEIYSQNVRLYNHIHNASTRLLSSYYHCLRLRRQHTLQVKTIRQGMFQDWRQAIPYGCVEAESSGSDDMMFAITARTLDYRQKNKEESSFRAGLPRIRYEPLGHVTLPPRKDFDTPKPRKRKPKNTRKNSVKRTCRTRSMTAHRVNTLAL